MAHLTRSAKTGGEVNGRRRAAEVSDEDFIINVSFSSYKVAARKRKLPLTLTREQFAALVQQDCWYCGGKPRYTWRKKGREAGPLLNGIDRIDNAEGYTVENSVSCCGPCNRAKHTLSREDFIALAKRIAERH